MSRILNNASAEKCQYLYDYDLFSLRDTSEVAGAGVHSWDVSLPQTAAPLPAFLAQQAVTCRNGARLDGLKQSLALSLRLGMYRERCVAGPRTNAELHR